MNNNVGIVLIATTFQEYFEMSLLCIKSLKEIGKYGGNITIFTDLNIKDKFDFDIVKINIPILEQKNGFRSRWIKTKLNELTPYNKTLYIDVDILAIKSINEIWNYSENNISMCVDPLDKICDVQKERINIPINTKYFNGGLILWNKCNESDLLFSTWHKNWLISNRVDQIPLANSLIETKIKIFELPKKYNTFLKNTNEDSILKHIAGGDHRYKLKNMK